MNLEKQIQMPKYICTTPYTCQNCELRSSDPRLSVGKKSLRLLRLGFNEIAQFLSKSEVLVTLSVFSSPYFFHQ
jgi:hypothetical protein